jgi:hypothetical protein
VKWRTFEVQREPGFRLNLTDLAFIALLLSISSALYLIEMTLPLVALVIYLGLSFFLFCNVFRIGNHLEPWWYLPFAMLAGWGVGWQQLESMWWIILTVLEPWKWLLIGYRIRSGHYVGAGYRRLQSKDEG